MSNVQQQPHAPSASDGRNRREYRTPQLVEFGDLAALTQTTTTGGKADGGMPPFNDAKS